MEASKPSSKHKPRFGFPGSLRLKKRSDFRQVQTKGRKLFTRHFLLIVDKREESKSRLGITITTKVEPRANRRNKTKRYIREIFRLNRDKFKMSFDILVIARKNACACDFQQVRKELLGVLKQAALIKTST